MINLKISRIRPLFQNLRGDLISRISALPIFRAIKFCENSRIWSQNAKSAKFNPNKVLDKGIDASEKVVHKAGEFTGNKIADAVTKSNDDNIEKQEPFEELIIPPDKRQKILNKMRKVL